eukprot:augustus_masked-scaffold_15-processed-gene-7.76-mRNA-1 protein AED:1.00 eAED:1.00 QI:0/-1/0/0/-1/1/1/0/357
MGRRRVEGKTLQMSKSRPNLHCDPRKGLLSSKSCSHLTQMYFREVQRDKNNQFHPMVNQKSGSHTKLPNQTLRSRRCPCGATSGQVISKMRPLDDQENLERVRRARERIKQREGFKQKMSMELDLLEKIRSDSEKAKKEKQLRLMQQEQQERRKKLLEWKVEQRKKQFLFEQDLLQKENEKRKENQKMLLQRKKNILDYIAKKEAMQSKKQKETTIHPLESKPKFRTKTEKLKSPRRIYLRHAKDKTIPKKKFVRVKQQRGGKLDPIDELAKKIVEEAEGKFRDQTAEKKAAADLYLTEIEKFNLANKNSNTEGNFSQSHMSEENELIRNNPADLSIEEWYQAPVKTILGENNKTQG